MASARLAVAIGGGTKGNVAPGAAALRGGGRGHALMQVNAEIGRTRHCGLKWSPDHEAARRESLEWMMPTDQFRMMGAFSERVPAQCRALPDATLREVAKAALSRVALSLPARPTPAPDAAETGALCVALCCGGIDAARGVIKELAEKGYGSGEILRGHLPAVARLMGEKWERDEVSFVEVGQVVGRLQRLVHLLQDDIGLPRTDPARRAVFATLPGETHSLGVVIAADAFRRCGWEIDLSLAEPEAVLVDQLAEQTHSVLGLSVGSVRTARLLAALVPRIRMAAPHTRILLSGAYVAAEPEAAARIAADGWAHDIPSALREMARLARSAA
ncbi:methanogenic corrinoid protein MtbC1 [Rhodovulum bhavnagarense]|uniref:Methanogenic corrinoid protein MtbC1 n=1 Tax=Rhodovulum bhavnagarense TaxID=992286 RepID=A0A4R2RCW9_9RHOB|nr:cobalamin B12-binding domain-containing protein [Rhodovulum bhavnagarense]TCP60294.1 methanogenic corrinoid protein MtbC1 [Rhodovulum bhavnagarense]